MLFIGDLHLKADKKEDIFYKLNETILDIDKENIIFLGDYIYHFSYNPKVIGEFFDLLLNYTKKGKKVYILAGNHDYIKGHFIFSEAEKIANFSDIDRIKIISKPTIKFINGKKILFFPFYTRIATEEEFSILDKKVKSYKGKNKDIINNIFFIAYQNFKQDNKNQKISGSINIDLLNFLIDEKPDILIHHFYIANTTFPGQFAKFSYKNIALIDEIFKLDLEIISGHLHKCFKHKNYICVGSFWNTSPLEENDTKIVYIYPNTFKQIIINPYISLEKEKINDLEKNILNKWNQIIDETEKNLGTKIKKDKLNLKQVNLSIKSRKYFDIQEEISKDILNKIGSITLKQISNKNINNILKELKTSKEKLGFSIESWKQLAKEYIEKKYPEKKEEYFKILEELELI